MDFVLMFNLKRKVGGNMYKGVKEAVEMEPKVTSHLSSL
jgi:hypothetical protein